jgi:hypothetical protein
VLRRCRCKGAVVQTRCYGAGEVIRRCRGTDHVWCTRADSVQVQQRWSQGAAVQSAEVLVQRWCKVSRCKKCNTVKRC